MSARLRGLLWLNLALQVPLGVGLFALAPERVFPGIDATGALCLRLAAFSNLSQALVAGFALSRREDAPLHRALVLAMAAYHVLAGAQAVALAWVLPLSALTEACKGPSVFHPILAVILLWGGLGARRGSATTG